MTKSSGKYTLLCLRKALALLCFFCSTVYAHDIEYDFDVGNDSLKVTSTIKGNGNKDSEIKFRIPSAYVYIDKNINDVIKIYVNGKQVTAAMECNIKSTVTDSDGNQVRTIP